MKTTPRELRKPNTHSAYHRELRKSLSLSILQKRILFGSLMGDGCLIENSSQSNHRLQIEHCDKQRNYVFWKYEIFKNFVLSPPFYLPATKSWKFRTISHPAFSAVHGLFYRGGRKILPENIDFLLDSLVCSIWFMDDGGRAGNGCVLNIQNFTDTECRKIQTFFHDTLSIPATLHANKGHLRLYIPAGHVSQWKDFLGDNLQKEFSYKLKQGFIGTVET